MADYIACRVAQVFIVTLFAVGMISLGIDLYTGRLPL
jgi:hypothetical protein